MACATRSPSRRALPPRRMAWLGVVCACTAGSAEAQLADEAAAEQTAQVAFTAGGSPAAGAPILEYRRDAAPAANPLRDQPATAIPAPTAAPPAAVLPVTPSGVVPAAATMPRPSPPTPSPTAPAVEVPDFGLMAADYEQATAASSPAAPAKPAPAVEVEPPTQFQYDGPSLQLAPRSNSAATAGARTTRPGLPKLFPTGLGQLKSLSTAGGALAIVVGLFLASTWLLRGSSGAKRTGSLPSEAFAVLGRAPLTAQSFAQLLRLGNKLILVSVAADGAQPLAEVTDPAEVDRLVGLCAKSAPHGATAEFQQVLEQLSREPARGFLGREGSAARRRA